MIADIVIKGSIPCKKTEYHHIKKIVRRIMKENHLVVKIKKNKKNSDYICEIIKAAENLIDRDFHSDS